MNYSCDEDEVFLQKIGETNVRNSQTIIFDCRTSLNAFVTRAKGGGIESEANYQNCKIKLGYIEGIVGLNSAYKSIMKICLTQSKLDDPKFLDKLDSSGWYSNVKKMIQGAIDISEWLHDDRMNVLVHCADGWDRTTILCSLTEILLDPYYRTIYGFEVLIEKDWIAFGHRFEER